MTPASSEPTCVRPLCRCCLQPVHGFVQHNFYDVGSKFYVHCKAPGCPLYYATREIKDWLTMDLAQWNTVQHPDWAAPANLLEVA